MYSNFCKFVHEISRELIKIKLDKETDVEDNFMLMIQIIQIIILVTSSACLILLSIIKHLKPAFPI